MLKSQFLFVLAQMTECVKFPPLLVLKGAIAVETVTVSLLVTYVVGLPFELIQRRILTKFTARDV